MTVIYFDTMVIIVYAAVSYLLLFWLRVMDGSKWTVKIAYSKFLWLSFFVENGVLTTWCSSVEAKKQEDRKTLSSFKKMK